MEQPTPPIHAICVGDDPPPSYSSGDEGSAAAEVDLEQQHYLAPSSSDEETGGGMVSTKANELIHYHHTKIVMASEMRKKRLSIDRSSRYNPDPPPSPPALSNHEEKSSQVRQRRLLFADEKPPQGILRQGRFFIPKIFLCTSRSRYRTLMAVATAFLIICAAAGVHFLKGGQLLLMRDGVYSRKLKGKSKRTGYDGMMAWLRAETAGLSAEERKRRLAVGKSIWPRCVNDRLSAIQCKELIDQDILDYNTDTDRFVRTIIVGKRQENDPLSNSLVLLMDDSDHVMGRDGDGIVYYDFKWAGSGNEATRYQQRKIPPIVAQEVNDEPTIDSIQIEMVPLRILGATTYDAINGSMDPISGGVKTLGTEVDTIEGETKLETALAESATIAQSGKRTIGPFDCSGMTGYSCCLMIKHQVRDSDTKGRAVQCYLDYHETTEKYKALLNARGKKVFIYENHNGVVTKDPKIVGDWPKGISSSNPDFHDWIQDGGGLSTGQMRLIYGPNWNPP